MNYRYTAVTSVHRPGQSHPENVSRLPEDLDQHRPVARVTLQHQMGTRYLGNHDTNDTCGGTGYMLFMSTLFSPGLIRSQKHGNIFPS